MRLSRFCTEAIDKQKPSSRSRDGGFSCYVAGIAGFLQPRFREAFLTTPVAAGVNEAIAAETQVTDFP
jgi:hypothetical protein